GRRSPPRELGKADRAGNYPGDSRLWPRPARRAINHRAAVRLWPDRRRNAGHDSARPDLVSHRRPVDRSARRRDWLEPYPGDLPATCRTGRRLDSSDGAVPGGSAGLHKLAGRPEYRGGTPDAAGDAMVRAVQRDCRDDGDPPGSALYHRLTPL